MFTVDLKILPKLVPFSFLPEREIKILLEKISIESHKRGNMLFIQGITPIDKIYIFRTGAAERYFHQNNVKILRGKLGEGDIIGAISILLNDGVIIRSIMLTEDSEFFTLEAADFLYICNRCEAFKEYFANIFGKQMLDRSYADIISRQMKLEDTSHSFFFQPLSEVCCNALVVCECDVSIQRAACQMNRENVSSIFIQDAQGKIKGIVTDSDLRQKVVATGYDITRPIRDIMAFPLKTISLQCQVFEAFIKMMHSKVKHLPLKNETGNIVGIVTDKDLIVAQGESPYLMMREIRKAEAISMLVSIYKRLPHIILNLMQSGAKAANLTKLISAVSDAILCRVIEFAITLLGPPPCRFAFMVMGSEGRGEQTLKTDQDNAILFEDMNEPDCHEKVSAYFLNFGNQVCAYLDEIGYDFCKGDNMAKNPQWCQPLKVWKGYFHDWIRKGDAQSLLNASIFFDFRVGWGDFELVDELRDSFFRDLGGWMGFFRNLAENALRFNPPIGFFRNIVVESQGEHKNAFDIKLAMHSIIDFARIYALKNYVIETDTRKRLFLIYRMGVITEKEYHDVINAHNYLLQLRLERHVAAIVVEKKQADNFCNPHHLSRLDRKILKEIFKMLERLQLKLRLDFIRII